MGNTSQIVLVNTAAQAAQCHNTQPPPVQSLPGETKEIQARGVVSSWIEGRGFGWVTFDDGTFAYIHNSQCGGEHCEQGEVIHADIVASIRNPGKWEAHNVIRGFGSNTS